MAHKFWFLPSCHRLSEPWPLRFFAVWSQGRGWGYFWERRGTRPWIHRTTRTNPGLYPHWGSGLISHSHSTKRYETTYKTTFIPHSSKWVPWSQSYRASCGCNPWWRHLEKRLKGKGNWGSTVEGEIATKRDERSGFQRRGGGHSIDNILIQIFLFYLTQR